MEEEIKSVFSDAKVELIESRGGVFDVELNGKLIFSKLDKVGTFVERFPDDGEIIKLIEKNL